MIQRDRRSPSRNVIKYSDSTLITAHLRLPISRPEVRHQPSPPTEPATRPAGRSRQPSDHTGSGDRSNAILMRGNGGESRTAHLALGSNWDRAGHGATPARRRRRRQDELCASAGARGRPPRWSLIPPPPPTHTADSAPRWSDGRIAEIRPAGRSTRPGRAWPTRRALCNG